MKKNSSASLRIYMKFNDNSDSTILSGFQCTFLSWGSCLLKGSVASSQDERMEWRSAELSYYKHAGLQITYQQLKWKKTKWRKILFNFIRRRL